MSAAATDACGGKTFGQGDVVTGNGETGLLKFASRIRCLLSVILSVIAVILKGDRDL